MGWNIELLHGRSSSNCPSPSMHDTQEWRFLVESGVDEHFPKITLGYFWSPNTHFILNWATFGAQAGIFDTERPDCWTFVLLNKTDAENLGNCCPSNLHKLYRTRGMV